MARQETVKRFEAWKDEPGALDEFWALIEGTSGAGGKKAMRFRDACMAIGRPYTLMYAHVHGNEALKARYESLLRSKADDMAHEAKEIADSVEPEKDAIAKARLQVDTNLALAAKWHDELYGNRIRVDKTVTHQADAGLLGTAAELLKKVSGRKPVTLENEAAQDVLPAAVNVR